ncbi:hypothetical protein PG993_011021 [Apiospora rasikravindrae]|uniref:Uncharacterized protein n=1 Tax=Apiospora rasikravindrae TaxID=990691 RepID=A0ABR1SE87_9PEZI
MGHISSAPELKPEVNLASVNREAREVVECHHKDFQTLSIKPRVTGRSGVVSVDIGNDMFYLINLKHSIQAMIAPLQQNPQIGQNLRHLALPLFEIARWPDKATQDRFDTSLQPTGTPWLLPGLPAALAALPTLQTLCLVVDRLFSVPFGIAHRRIPRRIPNLVGTRTELRALAKSQPRDAYGFSDYDAFVVYGGGGGDNKRKLGYEWPIEIRPVRPPGPERDAPHPRQQPPLFSFPRCRVDVRLVVDLDSNANARGGGERLRIPDEKTAGYTTGGYDRYFARDSAVLDWYADVSGHARGIRGYEEVSADGKVVQIGGIDDTDFVIPGDAATDLDQLSSGSSMGSDSDSQDELLEKEEKKKRPMIGSKKALKGKIKATGK